MGLPMEVGQAQLNYEAPPKKEEQSRAEHVRAYVMVLAS